MLRETPLHAGTGGATFTDYVYGAGLLAKYDHAPAGSLRSDYHVDHLGTPRLKLDGNGQITRYYMYYPYGRMFNEPAGTDLFPMRYTGHERDLLTTESAVDDTENHHARRFSLLTARYQSPDPIGGDTFRPQSWNLFAYVEGNPMNFVDPTGMDFDCFPIVDKRGEVIGQDCYERIDVVDGRGGPGGGGGGGKRDSRGHERERERTLVDDLRQRAADCAGSTAGLTVSFIYPGFGSDGRPEIRVIGWNVQLLPGALGVYQFGNAPDRQTAGGGLGASLTGNFGIGEGGWGGEVREVSAGVSQFSGGYYSALPAASTGWSGFEYGTGAGLPSGVSSTNDYWPLLFSGNPRCK